MQLDKYVRQFISTTSYSVQMRYNVKIRVAVKDQIKPFKSSLFGRFS